MSVLVAFDETFGSLVLENELPVLVDFWAPWCGPCLRFAPTLVQIADELAGRLAVVKINVDTSSATAQAFSVRSIPRLLLFRGGEVVGDWVGSRTKRQLLTEVEPLLA